MSSLWKKPDRTACALGALLALLVVGCRQEPAPEARAEVEAASRDTLFTLMEPAKTGLVFINELQENDQLNILTYEYLYNGGGVAVGDINNDSLPDVFLVGNLFGGRLFLNKGNLQFEQISKTAGVFFPGYTTGVSMVDINEDGWLDIYLCRSLADQPEHRANVLLINNGDLTFTDRAAEYGLDDRSFSNHANFFDCDNDGDLDLYLLNHRVDFDDALTLKTYTDAKGHERMYRDTAHHHVSDRLYRNNGNGTFTDITRKAGMLNRAFGLSATAADINRDGWTDLYVANDYADRDHLYINNRDGTFTDRMEEMFFHTSKNAMGSDIADFNNDGYPDLITLDMMAEDNYRQKQLKGTGSYDRYQMAVQHGLSHQVMRNTLQLNNGDGTFSEIGQLAGISHTDWSWSPLLADLDNDGWKDLFISNGYFRDVTDMDYMKYASNKAIEQAGGLSKVKPMALTQLMPSNPVPSYAFRNERDLTFSNRSGEWGITHPAFSNGVVAADLDRDGDLDLVANNLNGEAFLYRNNARALNGSHYLTIRLEGAAGNPHGTGATVTVKTADHEQVQEVTPYRGFLSSQEPVLHFGLGERERAAEVTVTWPGGQAQTLTNVPADQLLSLRRSEATAPTKEREAVGHTLLHALTTELFPGYAHQEDDFIDFKREPLLEHQLSNKGPFLAQGDVNGDGLEDAYLGASAGFPGQLFQQLPNGQYRAITIPAFEQDAAFEDAQALFIDVDNDRHLDLYVVSGGAAFPEGSKKYADRLYMNDGQGGFVRARAAIPEAFENGTCVMGIDADEDGDMDLFVGGGVLPGAYPNCARSHFLVNDGAGKFEFAALPEEGYLGMVNDVLAMDHDKDRQRDLILAGEWMPITVLKNAQGQWLEKVAWPQTSGWWNVLEAADLDGDGDLDLIAGNRGNNSFYNTTPALPARIYAKDFDANGSIDALPFYPFNDGQLHPKHTLDEVFAQYPGIRRKFTRYRDYSSATLEDLFTPEELEGVLQLSAATFGSAWFENQGAGDFVLHALPHEAQFSEVHGILPYDVDRDGSTDLLLTGNNYGSDVEQGRSDASIGTVLLNDGKGTFSAMPARQSGFRVIGDARGVELLHGAARKRVVVLRNGSSVKAFDFR